MGTYGGFIECQQYTTYTFLMVSKVYLKSSLLSQILQNFQFCSIFSVLAYNVERVIQLQSGLAVTSDRKPKVWKVGLYFLEHIPLSSSIHIATTPVILNTNSTINNDLNEDEYAKRAY